MSSAESLAGSVYPAEAMVTSDSAIPRLENGDQFTRDEFERRYDAMPNLKKADLIEGVVYLGTPVRFRYGQHHANLMGWLGYYVAKTPRLELANSGSNRLDNDNMPQPDAMLLLPRSAGSAASIDKDDYVSGAPDLVCEVAASNVSLASGRKLDVCRRSGVREYLVVRVEDQAIDGFQLRAGRYDPIQPGDDGVLRSGAFPGLWLDPAALLSGDLPKLFALIDQAASEADHQQFVASLQAQG